MSNLIERAWRYHTDYEPTIFEGEAIQIAEKAGWVDSPAKLEPKGKNDADANINQNSKMENKEANSDEEVALGFQIPENLIDLSVKKLKKLCKHRGLTGYSNMREAELVALLEG